ncbi:MAG: hypothetical protein ACXVCY_06545 [Pseudobdellovibrionaceae bacterium]
MKKLIMSSVLTMTFGVGAMLAPSVSLADKVTWQQRQELYTKGTITDAAGKTWNVIYLPGTAKVANVSKDNLKTSWDILKKIGTEDFWKDRYHEVKKGYYTAKDATENYWLKGMKEDYSDAKTKSDSIKKGDFGAFPAKTATWAKFGFKVVGRTVTFPVGVAYGLGVESAAVPLFQIIGYPVAGSLYAVGGGAVVPGVMYAWNGVAWVSTSMYSNEPTRENFFIRIKSGSGQESKDLVIDKKGFDTLLIGSVLKALNEGEVDQLQTQIDELIKKERALYDKKNAKYDELYANQSYKLYEQLLQDAYSAKSVTMDEQSKEVLVDDAKLTELIKEYLVKLGAEPTDEKVNAVKFTLKKNLEGMLREMAVTSVTKS